MPLLPHLPPTPECAVRSSVYSVRFDIGSLRILYENRVPLSVDIFEVEEVLLRTRPRVGILRHLKLDIVA